MNEYMKRLGRRGALLGGAAVVTAGWRFGNPAGGGPPDTIAALPLTLGATVNVSFSGAVCTFTCSNATLGPSAFTTDINWGDGSAHTVGSITGPAGGTMTVSGFHTYTAVSGYTIVVLVSKVGAPTVNATASSTMTVSGTGGDTITALSTSLATDAGTAYNGIAGSFSCSNTTLAASAFTGTLNWGDTGSTTVTGTVTGSGGAFTVGAPPSHTYAAAGTKSVTATLKITANPVVTATATNTMTVNPVAIPGTLRATVTLNAVQDGGGSFIYDESTGTNKGNYVDPPEMGSRFTESCFRVTRVDCPLRVDFRRLSTGNRTQVIFSQSDYTQNRFGLYPYTVVISGTELTGGPVTINVPGGHAPFQRWRWLSGPWPFPAKTPTEITAAGYLPSMNGALARGTGVNPGVVAMPPPLGTANITPYMPTGGERDDIGLVTAQQAWLFTQSFPNATSLGSVLAEAEAAGAFDWDIYDPATGNCIDSIVDHPGATVSPPAGTSPLITPLNSDGFAVIQLTGPPGTVVSNANIGITAGHADPGAADGTGQLIKINTTTIPAGGVIGNVFCTKAGPPSTPPILPFNMGALAGTVTVAFDPAFPQGLYGSRVTIDTAHMPAFTYIPFLLTGDSYHLENLQRMAMWIPMENGSAPPRSYGITQPRAAGWSMRTFAEAARASPASPPSWLHPASKFMTALTQWSAQVYPLTVGSAEGRAATFHLVSGVNGLLKDQMPDMTARWIQPYQEDFCHCGMSLIVYMNPSLTQWKQIHQWHVQQHIHRTNAALNDWATGYPTTFCIMVSSTELPPGPATYYSSWLAVWNATAPLVPELNPYTQVMPLQVGGSFDYVGTMGMAMNLSWQAGNTSGANDATPGATRIWNNLIASVAANGYAGAIPLKYCFSGPVS